MSRYISDDSDDELNRLLEGLDNILGENSKLLEREENLRYISENSKIIVEDIDEEFEKETKLDKLDIKFLFFAVALQCIRQYLLTNDIGRDSKHSDGDKRLDPLKKRIKKLNLNVDYKQILLNPVPYDAISTLGEYSSNDIPGLSGTNHRVKALGHDPLLGWVIGTLNITTSTVTTNNILLKSYCVNNNKVGDKIPFIDLLEEGLNKYSNDVLILIASVVKQAMHYSSDAFTKMGLPVPIINNIDPEFTIKLQREYNIDMYSVARGIAASSTINMIIAVIHSLFYDQKKYSSKDLYCIKTRKIIDYSNIIASSSNIIITTFASLINSKNKKMLDLGGILVAIYRVVNDKKIINQVKQEFIVNKFCEKIKEC